MKYIWSIISFSFFLLAPLTLKAQDSIYICKDGVVIDKHELSQIDSLIFYRGELTDETKSFTINEGEFLIYESASNEDIVGTVGISGNYDDSELEYSIIGGNIHEIFQINSSDGTITVADSNNLDYENCNKYELGVKVQDANNIATGKIDINIGDIKEIPMEGLIAYYPGENNANDNTEYQLHLSGNSSFTNDRDGNENAAFDFNGNSGYTLRNQELTNQSTPQTISLWVKTSSLNNVDYGGLFFGLLKSTTAGTGSRFLLAMINGTIKASYGDEYGDYNKWNEMIISKQTYNDNNWHHVVFVSNGDNESSLLIIDGLVVGTKVFTKSNNNSYNNIDIKLGGDKYQNYFTGCLDDVALYNRALTITEILQIYNEK